MGPFWGWCPVRFDAVFNKTASLAQSLYARARVRGNVNRSKHPKWTPMLTPRSHRQPEWPNLRVQNTFKTPHFGVTVHRLRMHRDGVSVGVLSGGSGGWHDIYA